MTGNLRPVTMGEIVVSADPADVLVAYGLSSCIAVCLYDPIARVGGMLHSVLPAQAQNNGGAGKPAWGVEQGVPLLVRAVTGRGANKLWLKVTLCGGGRVLVLPGCENSVTIGQLNIQAARTALRAAGFFNWREVVGGQVGRTVRLYLADGRVTIKEAGQPERVLAPAE